LFASRGIAAESFLGCCFFVFPFIPFHFIESFSPLCEEVFTALRLQLSFFLDRDRVRFAELVPQVLQSGPLQKNLLLQSHWRVRKLV
jgi:hypothetical protein